jgi:hypothetical protein
MLRKTKQKTNETREMKAKRDGAIALARHLNRLPSGWAAHAVETSACNSDNKRHDVVVSRGSLAQSH